MRFLLLLLLVAACDKPPPAAPAGFVRKGPPRAGDWLARFDEPGRSFENYVASRPVRARPGDVLAFLPVGAFDAEQRAVFDRSVEFAGLWFGLATEVLPAAELPAEGFQRERYAGRQYRTDYFLRRLLPERRPEHAVCLFGVTMADLYPDPKWNFVFGQASLRDRVAIWSYARYFARFWDEAETDATRKQALRRACQLVVHEAGHAFGLWHCIEYECVMNGSNSLEESDRQPLHLCPVCLKKLAWNRGFDVAARYRRLAKFYRAHGFEPEAAWAAARVSG